jgi:hypothetical protein
MEKKYYAVVLADNEEAEEYWFGEDKFTNTDKFKFRFQWELSKISDVILRLGVGHTLYFSPDMDDPNSCAIIKRIQ